MTINHSFTETKNNPTVEPKEYPWLGIYVGSSTYIVLFTKPNTGTYLGGTAGHKVGYWSDNWTEELYKPFKGTITYEQEDG